MCMLECARCIHVHLFSLDLSDPIFLTKMSTVAAAAVVATVATAVTEQT